MSDSHLEWRRVKEFAQTEIEAARTKLESCPLEEVAALQARVQAFRDLLNLNEPKTEFKKQTFVIE